MRQVSCPACAAGLEVDDRFALFLVCESCDSTIVVDKEAARIHGKMGALIPPEGLLYLGARGSLSGIRFEVRGRVRYGYARGFWNEWLISLEDGQAAWISEDEDELTREVLVQGAEPEEGFKAVSPGDRLSLAGGEYHLDEKDVAVCEGGEGMLPFPIIFGEKVPFLELSSPDGFATVEYGADGARVFVGSRLERADLVLDVSRADAGIGPDVITSGGAGAAERVVLGRGASAEIDCDSCGAPLVIPDRNAASHECEYCGVELDLSLDRKPCAECHKTLPLKGGEATHAATCPHCNALLDVRSEKTALIMSLAGRNRPSLPVKVGMKGRLLGQAHEVLGHLRLVERDSSGTYSSNEFLLRREDGQTAWLVLEDGHYSYRTRVHSPPPVDPKRLEEEDEFHWEGRTWEVDDTSEGASESIDWVEGEFTWVPKVGDTSSYMEAESPPYTLCAEWTAQEMEWFRGQYVSPGDVATAFGLRSGSMSRPSGVKAGAPPAFTYPPKRSHLWGSLCLAFVCVMISAGTAMTSRKVGKLEVTLSELFPPEHLVQAHSAKDARIAALAGQKVCERALVEGNQTKKLKAKAQLEQGKTHGVKHRERYSKGLVAEAKAFQAAFQHFELPSPTVVTSVISASLLTSTTELMQWAVLPQAVTTAATTPAIVPLAAPMGAELLMPLSPLARAQDAQAKAAAEALPSVVARLPTSWPSRSIEVVAGKGELGGTVFLEVPIRGDWIQVSGTIHREEDGSDEPVAVFSRTLLSARRISTVRKQATFLLPEPGRYWLHLRAVTGRRGSDRLALLEDLETKLKAKVSLGTRSGRTGIFGAFVFFLWFLGECLLRVVQISFYAARLTVQAVTGGGE